MNSQRQRALAWYAKQWVGFVEEGENRGQVVERFQKAVDGKAQGEPWCCAFVQFLLHGIDDLFEVIEEQSLPGHAVYHTELVMAMWDRTGLDARISEPEIGTVAVWLQVKDNKFTGLGHTGVVVNVSDDGTFTTIEGNTSPSLGVDQREGDGVWVKECSKANRGSLQLVGFLKPWKE